MRRPARLLVAMVALPLVATYASAQVTPTGAPVTPTGAPATPTGGPATPTGAPITPTGVPATPTGAPVTPTGTPTAPPGLRPTGLTTDFQYTRTVNVGICLPTDRNKLIDREKDASGLLIEIYCNHDYRMKVTRPDGTVVYAGKCKFDRAVNLVQKKIVVRVQILLRPDGSLVYWPEPNSERNPKEINWTYWKNIEAVGEPPASGTEGPIKEGQDLLWIYVPATNQIVLQKTKSKGKWVKKQPAEPSDPFPWQWQVVDQAADGAPTPPRPAPDSPAGLEMAAVPPGEGAGRCAAIPTPPPVYQAHTPIPVTVAVDGRLHTVMLRQRAGAELFEAAELDARVNHLFVFHVDLPGEPERLTTFRLLKAPEGMTIGPYTGIIEWTPRDDQAGDHVVAVEYAFGELGAFSDEFVLRVAGPTAGTTPVWLYALLLVLGGGLGVLGALAYKRSTLRRRRPESA